MILSKRRWLFIYVVYLDVLVLQNLLLDLASLLTLGIWQKKRVCWYRIFPAAVVGCVFGSAMFLCVHQFCIYVMGIALLVNPCMLWIAYGKKNPKECFVCYFYLILIYWVLGGVASLLLLYLPKRMEKICLPLSCVVLCITTVLVSWRQKKRRHLRQVAFFVCGHVEKMVALVDTGNLLQDPYSGMPVCVISEQYRDVWEIPQEKVRYVPYETVAGSALMEAVVADRFLIQEQGDMVCQKKVMIGFGKDLLFQGKNYQMILHKDFCWE